MYILKFYQYFYKSKTVHILNLIYKVRTPNERKKKGKRNLHYFFNIVVWIIVKINVISILQVRGRVGPTNHKWRNSPKASFLQWISRLPERRKKKKTEEDTWLAKPMPKPSKIRPRISIQTALAAPLIIAPEQNNTPPNNIDHFRPNVRVTVDATNDDNNAAK